MFRIERTLNGSIATLRLAGRVRAENIDDLQRELDVGGPLTALDLEDVSLVDVEVVRFLRNAEGKGTELQRCPPFVREWIYREQ
jgi:hypothetical protein